MKDEYKNKRARSFAEAEKLMASKIAEYRDGASFAYVERMIKELKSRGEDLTKYELVFATKESPEIILDEDGARMVVRQCLQLRKIPELESKL